MPGWKKHMLESRLSGEIEITSDMQMTPLLWQRAKRNFFLFSSHMISPQNDTASHLAVKTLLFLVSQTF